MDQYEPGVAIAVAHLAELRRKADQRRLARRIAGRTADRRGNRAPRSSWVLGRGGQGVDGASGAALLLAVIALLRR